jgi:hypothetical protein
MDRDELKKFQKFGKRNEETNNCSKEVWSYTRVSSIEQKDNYSLDNQDAAAKLYAANNGYQIVRTF